MKVLVCGGRNFHDYSLLEDTLNKIWRADGEFTIIHGCARGADSLAGKYAELYFNAVEEFPADWDKHGKAAGSIRNQQMLDEGKPDLIVAFKGGNGTADMIRRATKAGIEVIRIDE